MLGDSSSELGYREISMDYSSMSSDTRGSVDGTAQDVNASHVVSHLQAVFREPNYNMAIEKFGERN